MEALLLGLVVLACSVGMGLLMWMMIRGPESAVQELARLRAEVDQLRASGFIEAAAGVRR